MEEEDSKYNCETSKGEITDFSYQENKGEKVQVFVRIRPFLKSELELDNTSPITEVDVGNNIIKCKIIL